MTRDAYTDRLLDLAYGELSKREAREVEAHAASCEACRAELDRIRGTRRIMAALPDEPAPDRGERILLAAAREAAEARRPRRLSPRWLLGGAVAAASLAVVAVVSYRVVELTPKRDDRTALLGESPYASPPPAPQGAAAPPAQAEPGVAALSAAPSAAPAPEAKGVASEPARVEESLRAIRRERSSVPPSQGPQTYASPPPPAPAPAPRGGLEAESRAKTAAERYAVADAAAEGSAAPGGAAAPAAPSAAPRAPVAAASGAMRKSAAAPEAQAGYGAADASAAAEVRTGVRTFPGCEGESVRRVEVDARGRTMRYVREGTIAGRRLRIDHAFAPDGRPAGVTVTDLDAPGALLDARALGLSLPASAADAGLDAPPRCGR